MEGDGRVKRAAILLSVFAFVSLCAGTARPTPYWDEADFLASRTGVLYPGGAPGRLPLPGLLAYSYPYQLARIAHFLSVWQVSDSLSPHFGGMREGECCGLESIIETDNTQEAIWVWCKYGEITGDTARYRPNIDAAWTYVGTNPAYLEEGTDSPYYRVHNCGWALVAFRIFAQVYDDSSKRVYADSCADYIAARKDSLVFDDFSFYGRLHPMVAGWGAGTLYRYGVSTGVTAYVDTALVIGARVADWVDSNCARRLSDEVWAMSSGTKMWGVVNSVVANDPAGWAGWLSVFAESLEIYQDPATWNDWNNSWNIWYANAHGAIGEALGDPSYLAIHRMLVDTLLGQDRDADGGIPANTMHPDTMDQTWVSCYLGMMGIGGLLDSLPANDVGAMSFLSPSPDLIVPVGDSVAVTVTAVNFGLASQSGVPIEVSGGFSAATTVDLSVASTDTAYFPGVWVPSVDSVYELSAYTRLASDEDLSNDTLKVTITILPVVTVTGTVKDSVTLEGIDAWLYFLRTGSPRDTLWDSTSTDTAGHFSLDVVTGVYDVDIVPGLPYPRETLRGINVTKDSVPVIDVELGPATLLLVDDDEGKTYESYYTSALDTLGVTYITWDVSESGEFPVSLVSLFGSPIVIWFTGDAVTNTLTPADRESLGVLLDSGGNLFVTGQNVGQDLDTTFFLSDYLHAALVLPTTNDHTLYGVTGDPVGDGLSILTAGSPGAGNQVSQDVISPLAGADSVLMYSPIDCAGIKYDSGVYKVVYFGFGFEGVASRPEQGYNTNWYLLRRVLNWFDPSIVAVEEPLAGRRPLAGDRLLLRIEPNPFTTAVAIVFESFICQGGNAEVDIYDLSGRFVKTVWKGTCTGGVQESRKLAWDGSSERGEQVPSGVYFVRYSEGGRSLARKVVLVR
jgi:hypothetical protein